MSANLLKNPAKIHALADDLESFLHVLGWMTLRYVPAIDNYLAVERGCDMTMYDEYLDIDGYWKKGGNSKSNVLGSGSYPSRTFLPRMDTPLFQLIRLLSMPFKSLYDNSLNIAGDDGDDAALEIRRYNRDMQRLQNPSWFIDGMETALGKQGWPTDDKADATLPIARLSHETEIQVRNRTSQLQSNHKTWIMSKGVPRGSKREASPTPESSSKRRRGTPATSELHIS